MYNGVTCVRSRVVLPFKAVGGRDPTPPLQSPQEQMMRDHIVDTLKGKNMEMKTVVRRFILNRTIFSLFQAIKLRFWYYVKLYYFLYKCLIQI